MSDRLPSYELFYAISTIVRYHRFIKAQIQLPDSKLHQILFTSVYIEETLATLSPGVRLALSARWMY
jgi:hypothetical protein